MLPPSICPVVGVHGAAHQPQRVERRGRRGDQPRVHAGLQCPGAVLAQQQQVDPAVALLYAPQAGVEVTRKAQHAWLSQTGGCQAEHQHAVVLGAGRNNGAVAVSDWGVAAAMAPAVQAHAGAAVDGTGEHKVQRPQGAAECISDMGRSAVEEAVALCQAQPARRCCGVDRVRCRPPRPARQCPGVGPDSRPRPPHWQGCCWPC